VTEKKKLEKELKESELKFRELFNNASDCIYTINLEGQFLTVNDTLVKALKCASHQEVLASNMYKWITLESLEKAKKFIQEVITEEDYYNKSVVIEVIRKDGMHVWFEHKQDHSEIKIIILLGSTVLAETLLKKSDLSKRSTIIMKN